MLIRWRALFAVVGLAMAVSVGLLFGRSGGTNAAQDPIPTAPSCDIRQAGDHVHIMDMNSLALPFALLIQKADQPRSQRGYVGFQDCLRCHNAGIQGTIIGPGGVEIPVDKEQYILYREYPIWAKDDKHGQAYTILLNKRSKNIGAVLGVAEIHRDKRCLACHTGFPLSLMTSDNKSDLVEESLVKKLDINLGVSCEGCHGPAGDRQSDGTLTKGWMVPHQTAPSIPYEKDYSLALPLAEDEGGNLWIHRCSFTRIQNQAVRILSHWRR